MQLLILSKGNFVSAPVTLTQNKLSRFESGVFQSMLEQMSATPYGYLDVRGSKYRPFINSISFVNSFFY